MAQWLVVLLFIVAILVVVVIHEAGHFSMAKLFGIKVEEFFVGFGPRIWSFRRGETEYGVKAIPAGGYVRIAGMNPFQEPSPEDIPRTFGAKPIWQRAVVIAAGPITHFIMAIVFLAIFFSAIGIPRFRPVVGDVCALDEGSTQVCPTQGTSPALEAGLLAGDEILAIDGRPAQSSQQVSAITRSKVGKEVELTVRRDGEELTVRATPVLSEVDGRRFGRLGIILDEKEIGRDKTDPFTAVGRATIETGRYIKEIAVRLGDVFGPAGLKRIGQLVAGSEQRSSGDVVSIVGAGRLAAEAAEVGAWEALLQLFVLFNVFVGILNIVPLPPLDGGHLAVLAVEKIRGRKVDARKLVPLTAVVAAFMILFGLAIIYLDIVKPLPNPFR